MTWDPNPPEEEVLGYQVRVGNAFGVFAVYDVGNQTFFVYPDAVAGQEYLFTVEAYNAFGLSPHAELSGFSNAPPDLVGPGNQVYALGEAVALQLQGSDRYGEPVSYGASGLPPGLTLTASTGLIAGAGTEAGIYHVTVTVFDGVLSAPPQSFTWFIDGAPPTVAITFPTTQATYSNNVNTIALGGTAGDDLGIASITWVNSLGGTGAANVTTPTTWQIPAVPLWAGENVITVTVRDVANYTTADVITVTSSGAGIPFVQIGLPTSAPSFVVSATTITLGGTATDIAGISSVTWTTDRGGSGTAQLNTSQGVTFWNAPAVPLQRGTNVITATASNAVGNSGTAVLTVERLNNPPALNDPGSRSHAEGDVVSLQLTGSDSDGDAITYTAAGLPPGLTLDPSSGLISGTLLYTAAGVHSTTLAVSDGTSTKFVSPSWTVANTNLPPVVTNPGAQGAFQGVGFALAMSGVDEDSAPLTWSAQDLPPGIAINASTGMLSGTPTTLGTFATVISASDSILTAQASFAWTVASPLPPGPASPASPSGITGTATPAFSWPAVPLTGYYALSISDAGGGSPILAWYTPAQAGCAGGTGTCTVAAPRALGSGLVSWKVITWNPYGYGPWSTTLNVVVDLTDASVPTPTVVGPSGPIGTRTPTYSWYPIDDATWYQVSVTDALGIVREFWYTSAEACDTTACGETPNALLAIGPAQWRMRAWRASGAGAWTAPVNFEAVDAAPGKATLVSPAAVSSATPAFTWNAVLGTSYYLLRVTDRDNIIIERWYRPLAAGCALGTGICTASLGTAINPGPANWLVLTWNGSGYGPWSDPRNFSVEVPDPSAATPETISPTGLISSPTTTYRWTAVAGATSYRLSIRNNGGAPAHWWYTPAGAGCAAAAECSVTPQAGLQDGTAEWQVQAWTPNGHSAWSAAVVLTVDIGAPAKPSLISPSGSASAAPTFVWNASASATLYYIRADDVTGQRVDRWLTPAQAGCPSGAGACAFDAGVTLSGGAASWQVIAWNQSGYSPWSSTLGFVVP